MRELLRLSASIVQVDVYILLFCVDVIDLWFRLGYLLVLLILMEDQISEKLLRLRLVTCVNLLAVHIVLIVLFIYEIWLLRVFKVSIEIRL